MIDYYMQFDIERLITPTCVEEDEEK